MVDPIAALKAKKAKILADAQREAEALDADARELERLASLADKYGLALVEKDTGKLNGKEETEIPAFDPDGPVYKAAISVSENVLRTAGAPLELSVLYDACVGAGVRLGGVRPQSTLSAYLSHPKSTVCSIRKGLYWLKDRPRPDETPDGLRVGGREIH